MIAMSRTCALFENNEIETTKWYMWYVLYTGEFLMCIYNISVGLNNILEFTVIVFKKLSY